MRIVRYSHFGLFVVFFLLAVVTTASGRTIYVDADATGSDDGSSWADAYNYLQQALSEAESAEKPVEILAAQGTYRPDEGPYLPDFNDVRRLTFQLIDGVALKGGYAGFGEADPNARDVVEYETILSGDLNGDDGPDFANNGENSYHVVTGSGTGETAVLDGFTITAGYAEDILDTYDSGYGGGMYSFIGSPTLRNCKFIHNRAGFAGGGMCNEFCSNPVLTDCTFKGNSAQSGGGMFNCVENSPVITNCTFSGNHASYRGGGITNECEGSPTLTNCKIVGNTAGEVHISYGFGGGMSNSDGCNPVLINCIITGNSAKGDSKFGSGGGIYNWNTDITSRPTLINCAFAGNSAPRGSSLSCDIYYDGIRSTVEFKNCILWDSGNSIYNSDGSKITITYSDVRSGFSGKGNIKANPMFVDLDGADNVIGTEDDNLRLFRGSPCIDAGDNSAVPPSVLTDLDGNRRIINGVVDMGAYEFTHNWYVDALGGDDNNNGLSPETAFATIQKGVDSASNENAVLVYPGVYHEEIDFLGKAIVVQGVEGAAVIENPDYFAVSFYNGEGPDSILKNFVIENSFMAVFIVGSSPTISNVTVVGNEHGIEAFAGAEPNISSSIFWDNIYSDLFGCEARYSCTAEPGQGNIDVDPLFADSNNGDYHLLSERGRYWPEYDVWILDEVTSPCIDSGDPAADYSDEPMPDGGRINMGAYGGTAYASMKEFRWRAGDVNHDGWVNMTDFVLLAENWLKYEPPTASNWPPMVSIIGPQDGAELDEYENPIWAYAVDVDGWVEIVEFFANGTKIGEDDDGSDGWQIVWTGPPSGTHSIDAKATDNDGAVMISSPIVIEVPHHGKGMFCFPADMGVWVDGGLVRFSEIIAGQRVAGFGGECIAGCPKQVERIDEHEGVFLECYDIVLESGNRISVVGSHLFLTDSGRWCSARDLRASMKLRSMHGEIGIGSIARRPLPYIGRVYNLKVKNGDRYLVGKDGIVVRDY